MTECEIYLPYVAQHFSLVSGHFVLFRAAQVTIPRCTFPRGWVPRCTFQKRAARNWAARN